MEQLHIGRLRKSNGTSAFVKGFKGLPPHGIGPAVFDFAGKRPIDHRIEGAKSPVIGGGVYREMEKRIVLSKKVPCVAVI
jgi:hypothetical protein